MISFSHELDLTIWRCEQWSGVPSSLPMFNTIFFRLQSVWSCCCRSFIVFLTITLWCALFQHVHCAEDRLATGQQFPRKVDVIASQTYLRAGPGDDFYPTARLIHGETLELWSVSESGYGAVRPLTGSFSWLRAADVDREIENDPEVGVVITDGAVSRIGSQINAL